MEFAAVAEASAVELAISRMAEVISSPAAATVPMLAEISSVAAETTWVWVADSSAPEESWVATVVSSSEEAARVATRKPAVCSAGTSWCSTSALMGAMPVSGRVMMQSMSPEEAAPRR